jgi:hypothetical protein
MVLLYAPTTCWIADMLQHVHVLVVPQWSSSVECTVARTRSVPTIEIGNGDHTETNRNITIIKFPDIWRFDWLSHIETRLAAQPHDDVGRATAAASIAHWNHRTVPL